MGEWGEGRQRGGPLLIDGESLSLADALAAAMAGREAVLAPAARQRVAAARRQVEQWVADQARPVYGINTGVGPLKNAPIPPEAQGEYQRRQLLSHSVTAGRRWPLEVIRLALLLRANVLARGHSGVRPELIDRLLLLLNRGVTPVAHAEGSLGLGDLPPMAEVGLAVAGYPEGRARWRDEEGPAPDILARAGIHPVEFPLAAREALALLSGSTVTLAATIFAVEQVKGLCRAADLAAALTLEALRGEPAAFDARIHQARFHPGQAAAADHIRRMVMGSGWLTPAARRRMGEEEPRVQEAISLRSTPQVHGAVRDTLDFALTVIAREINASTDNPLIFTGAGSSGAGGDGPGGSGAGGYRPGGSWPGGPGPDDWVVLSGGNSHGAPVSYMADFLAIALADLAVLSERRSSRLLDPALSYGLPANLVQGDPGINSGLAVAQGAATSMLAELRTLSYPATGSSLATKSSQEDHVSMGTWAARKLLRAVELVTAVLAMEILCACQAIDLAAGRLQGLSLGQGTGRVYRWVRRHLPAAGGDYLVRPHWQQIIRWLESGQLLAVMDG